MNTARTQTTPLVARLEEFIREIPGWTPLDQLLSLFLLAYSTKTLNGSFVEIGSWCGRSSCALGLAAQAIGSTILNCIDLFPEKDDWYRNADGSYSLKVTIDGQSFTAYDKQTVWKAPFTNEVAPIYEKSKGTLAAFQNSVTRAELTSIVSAHRGSLATFLDGAPSNFKCKLVFIDGDHGYEAVKNDIQNIEQVLIPGGWICFDDAFTTSTGVDRAISEFILGSPKYELAQQVTRKLFVARRV
jgi:predicted O-methyltransferase YrrM